MQLAVRKNYLGYQRFSKIHDPPKNGVNRNNGPKGIFSTTESEWWKMSVMEKNSHRAI